MKIIPDFSIEEQFKGKLIAGVDEAGRGPLAGPLAAAAVILSSISIKGIRDSKLISSNKRRNIYHSIIANYHYGIGIATVEEIDIYNVYNATKLACIRAVQALPVQPDIVIVDGNMRFDDARFHSFVKGDQRSVSIAAASIVAKVHRDDIMLDLATIHPEYEWHINKGYPTSQHKALIRQLGTTIWHRKSFKML